MVLLQPVEPMALLAREQLGCGLVCERGEVLRVRASQLIATATLGEALQRVLADGAKHEEPRLTIARSHLAQEALLDQRSETVDDGCVELVAGTDVLDRVEPGAAGEYRQPPKERALVFGEQVVAPVDRAT